MFRASALLCVLALGTLCKVHAQNDANLPSNSTTVTDTVKCLPSGDGYLKARLAGAVSAELNWGNAGMECTGAVRPTDGGIRVRFTSSTASGEKLVLVFGISKLKEGQSAKAVPVNVTVIVEGAGEFFGTQGDDKCMLDDVKQLPIKGIPHRTRSYRIVARGFCTEPARAIRGKGSILISRFDFAGQVDFDEEDKEPEAMKAENRLAFGAP